jgi:hypothetical protein
MNKVAVRLFTLMIIRLEFGVDERFGLVGVSHDD